MPLPPLPANNTPRIFVQYTSAAFTHHLQLRFSELSTLADRITTVNILTADLVPFMHPSNGFLGAESQEAGEVFTTPVSIDTPVGTFAGSVWAEDPESAFMSVTARSDGGRRARWEFFTPCVLFSPWPLGNRVAVGSDAAAAGFLAAFENAAGEVPASIRAIDGLSVVFHQYVNIAKNAYWQRAQR